MLKNPKFMQCVKCVDFYGKGGKAHRSLAVVPHLFFVLTAAALHCQATDNEEEALICTDF